MPRDSLTKRFDKKVNKMQTSDTKKRESHCPLLRLTYRGPENCPYGQDEQHRPHADMLLYI